MIRRIMAKIFGWKKQPTKAEVEALYRHYRNEVMDKEVINNHLESKEFINLTHVARYAEFGLWTAIQAAFCLGYSTGQQELKDKINKHFRKEVKQNEL